MKNYFLLLPALLFLLISCSGEDSQEGDSTYSFLCAEFVEAHTAAASEIDRATTDDGELLVLSPHINVSWAQKADSTYRALLYYNKVENVGGTVIPISLSRVPVLRAKDATEFEEGVKTDPVKVESAWLSKGKAYLNAGLLLKTGVADDADAIQSIGLVLVSETDTDLTLRLYHDQGGVPQYYTSRVYVSIPLTAVRQMKTIHLLVNTNDGELERIFN